MLAYNRSLSDIESYAIEEYLSVIYGIPLWRPCECAQWINSCACLFTFRLNQPISLHFKRSAAPPPVLTGLMGWYIPQSYMLTPNRWNDNGISDNHVVTLTGTTASATENSTSAANYLNGQPYLYGGSAASMTFPAGILSAAHTLLHLARYNGATRGRIMSSSNINWLSGHSAPGLAGVALQNGSWITPYRTDLHGTGWVLSTSMRGR